MVQHANSAWGNSRAVWPRGVSSAFDFSATPEGLASVVMQDKAPRIWSLLSICALLCVSILTLPGCDADQPKIAEHVHGPHDGLVAQFFSGEEFPGWVEIKLHDDKGDLEVWLGTDQKMEKPFDLPVTASIEIEFLDEGKKVTLRPRNTVKNEDEGGHPNIRDGKTNYFIFPSKSSEDASWLKGKDFKALVVVRFESDGKKYQSVNLKLEPHTH